MAKPPVKHHDPDEIAEAFAMEPLRVAVSKAGENTVIEYFDDEKDEHLQVASIVIRLHEGGGVEATSFWVHPDYQGRGIFTNAHKWAVSQPFSLIRADTAEAGFYMGAGYKERESDGMLVMDNRKTKKWLKGR